MSNWRSVVVSGLGTGHLPVAPGTWGSAAVAVLYLALAACGADGWTLSIVMGALVVISSVACVALGSYAERHFGRTDPPQVTIDEWAGQAVALLAMPVASEMWGRMIIVGAAFAAFRLMDIFKPAPANRIQRLPGGWGILADDLVAGVYANIACQLALRWAAGMGG